jgi:high affinity Mn2+ porin
MRQVVKWISVLIVVSCWGHALDAFAGGPSQESSVSSSSDSGQDLPPSKDQDPAEPAVGSGGPSIAEPVKKVARYSLHTQATTVSQGHNAIGSPYVGQNSLSPGPEYRTSFTGTVFLGVSLWRDGQLYFNPELSAGTGVSQTHGVAGFPNGEIYRVDDPNPKPSPARIYLQQVFALSDEREFVEDDLNQIATMTPKNRFTLILGKFSLNDFFDLNTYAHDPRTQFLNWALWENGAWDYAADTRGYTVGVYGELNWPAFAIRYARVMEPHEANLMKFDTDVAQAHGDNLELEQRFKIDGHPGRTRLLGYVNSAHMGNYATTIATPAYQMDVTQSRTYCKKYGLGLGLEQEVSADVGVFLRGGWDDGKTETWAFTEIDQTVGGGLSIKGTSWDRESDVMGVAYVMNGISRDHRDYLQDGGVGFMVGDGTLTYGMEKIIESFYLYKVTKQFGATADLQYAINPGYNKDRGPATIMALRLHYEN